MHGRTRFQTLICGMHSRHVQPLDSGRNLYFFVYEWLCHALCMSDCVMLCVWVTVSCFVYEWLCHALCMSYCVMLCVWVIVSCFVYGWLCHALCMSYCVMLCVWVIVSCFVYGWLCRALCMSDCVMLCVWVIVPCFVYYRKRGSASYIVREWLLWEGERERERERERRLWRHSISRWNREWSCIWLPRRRVDPTRRRVLSLSSVHALDKELGVWALEQQAMVEWFMNDDRKWKLCVRWWACRGSRSTISLACFKQEK